MQKLLRITKIPFIMSFTNHLIIKYLILVMILSLSCNIGTRNIDTGYYLQNFDDLFYWNHSALVSSERAHSGSYSTYVDSSVQFSQTFEMNLGYARYHNYKKFRVKAWCFKETDDTQAGLTATVSHGEVTYATNSSDLAIALKKSGSWGDCTFSLELPAEAPNDAIIRIYLWTSNRTKAYMDDVEIIFKK